MDHNGTKLLFFDIDGTLFDDEHRLPPSVKPALEAARDKGCLLFLNTGRTYCNMDPRLNDLPWDGRITGCGTRIIFRGRTLKAMEYSPEETGRIRKIILESGIPVVYECDTAMYFDPAYDDYPLIGHFRRFSDNAGIGRTIREGDPEFRAVKMFGFSADGKPVRALLDRLGDAGFPYDAIDRGRMGWELVPAQCSKASGIDVIRAETGAALRQCYVFGDSSNDLSMLRHVPNSIAMGNAPEEVKRLCACVTDRPEEDGIRNALVRLGLI